MGQYPVANGCSAGRGGAWLPVHLPRLNLRVGAIDQRRCDLHDVAALALLHLDHGALRDVKEAGEIDPENRRIIGLGIFRERLRDEDAGIVDQRIDPPKSSHPVRDRAFGSLDVRDRLGGQARRVVGLLAVAHDCFRDLPIADRRLCERRRRQQAQTNEGGQERADCGPSARKAHRCSDHHGTYVADTTGCSDILLFPYRTAARWPKDVVTHSPLASKSRRPQRAARPKPEFIVRAKVGNGWTSIGAAWPARNLFLRKSQTPGASAGNLYKKGRPSDGAAPGS